MCRSISSLPPTSARFATNFAVRSPASSSSSLSSGPPLPRKGIDWSVGAVGGPRILGAAELERIRDALLVRIREAQTEIARRADVEEQNRGLIERMIAEPESYPWVQVSNEDVGDRECKHWHSRPRLGIIGMLMGWWRVKLSSGCPLAEGLAAPNP